MTTDKHYAAEFNRARHEWHLAEHITAPRRTWKEAQLERTMAPPDLEDIAPTLPYPEYKPGQCHADYDHIYMTPGRKWRGRYRYNHKRRTTPVRDTPFQAAMAYNDAVRARGLPRRYLIEIANMEDVA